MSRALMAAALDIGTTKITCLVGEQDSSGRTYVLGHGRAAVSGFKRGIVVDLEKTVQSIRNAIDDAQLVSGTEIDRVTVGIAGEHIRSVDSHGVVSVGRTDNEVTVIDVQRAIDSAKSVPIPVDREIIHVIPQEFTVDEHTGVKDPVGMSGVRLEIQAHIVTAAVTSARNLYRALERSKVGIDHIVFEPLALSEMFSAGNNGDFAIVDIGGEITSVATFHDGAIRSSSVIPLGGKHVTHDLAIGMSTTTDHAEELKLAYGCALASMVDSTEMVTVAGIPGSQAREISRGILASIIEPRMEEILTLVGRELRKEFTARPLTGGVIFTGGGSLLPGVIELAQQLYSVPIRRATLNRIEHTADEINSAQYATAHALLLYGFSHEPASEASGIKAWIKKLEQWITKQF